MTYSLALDFSTALVRAQGDFNGDGLTDFLITDSNGSTSESIKNPNTRTFSYLSKGDGTFVKMASPLNSSYVNGLVKSQGDYNGDGLIDFVLADSYLTTNSATGSRIKDFTVSVYYSRGNGTFHKTDQSIVPQDTIDNYLNKNIDVIADGDLNGDGLSEFALYIEITNKKYTSSTSISSSCYSPKIADPSGFPGLLKSVVFNDNAKSTVTYVPSSSYLNKTLPDIYQTVSSVSVDDGLGNTIKTEFDYSGGLYSASEREFRGFNTVIQKNLTSTPMDSETAIVDGQGNTINSEASVKQGHGTIIKTTYHQNKYLSGRVEKTEVFDEDGTTMISNSTNNWVYFEILNSSPARMHVYLSSKINNSYDNGVTVYSYESYGYSDIHGGLTKISVSNGVYADCVVTTKEYANYGDWVWRIKKETVNARNQLSGPT